MHNRRFPSPLAEPAAPGHFRNRRPACGLRLPGLPSRSGAGIPSGALQRIEAIDDPLLVNSPGTEHDRRKLGLVRTVGKGLALDRHAVAVPVLVPADASRAPLEPVPGVYLHSGLMSSGSSSAGRSADRTETRNRSTGRVPTRRSPNNDRTRSRIAAARSRRLYRVRAASARGNPSESPRPASCDRS